MAEMAIKGYLQSVEDFTIFSLSKSTRIDVLLLCLKFIVTILIFKI